MAIDWEKNERKSNDNANKLSMNAATTNNISTVNGQTVEKTMRIMSNQMELDKTEG